MPACLFNNRHRVLMSLLLLAAVWGLLPSSAQAFTPEPTTLVNKGYSVESVRLTGEQQQRQQWQPQTSHRAGFWGRVWHNFVSNNWTGNIVPFGEGEFHDPH